MAFDCLVYLIQSTSSFMYSVDNKDEVIRLGNAPQSSVGAPCPMISASEQSLRLAYFVEDIPSNWDGSTVSVIDENTNREPVALITFTRPKAHMFGPPNDEAFSGHPLASRGLKPYSVSEIRNSSWLRHLERMNAVHPYHKPELFLDYHHFVFSFHDTTFECISKGFQVSIHHGSVAEVIRSP
jgi:hypothetical protein